MIWIVLIVILAVIVVKSVQKQQYEKLEAEVLSTLGFSSWYTIPYFDAYATVKSRQAVEKYDEIKFFKDEKGMLEKAEATIKSIKVKTTYIAVLQYFAQKCR